MVETAYFSAEIGISNKIPSYSGGLGILAGDHLKAAADLSMSICGITLMYKEGYMHQVLDVNGWQSEQYATLQPENILKKLPYTVDIQLRDRRVCIAIWEHTHKSEIGGEVKVYFLDTDIDENHPDDRVITKRLYGGDREYRLLQEAVLGFGGIEALQVVVRQADIKTFHMNEGHCAFVTTALRTMYTRDEVKSRCVFTTHTPVPAGHDVFSMDLVNYVLGDNLPDDFAEDATGDSLNMTVLAMNNSRHINGVSRLHGQVSSKMFPGYKITSITNGVHHRTWSALATRKTFDLYLPGWRENAGELKYAQEIPYRMIETMHHENKRRGLDYINAMNQAGFSQDILTIGFARRAASYKRAWLILSDPERLKRIASGRLQIVFAGKAHPQDNVGKTIIQDIVKACRVMHPHIIITFLENYNMWLGRLLTSSVDVWLNTPIKPHEACGTSGMKAALNGVLNLSVTDGWWDEACRHGENGWGIDSGEEQDDRRDADRLYNILEHEVIPIFYEKRRRWLTMMRESIVTAADFSAQRMVREYQKVYEKSESQ